MSVALRPEAEEDLRAARRWYERQRQGLGGEFVEEVDRALTRISAGPQRFPKRHRDLRRALLRRFPFAIYFSVDAAGIVVVAVLHQRRDIALLKRREI